MSVNKVIILGRLGQDPELKHTPGGMSVCNFTVATSESWADKAGQKQERTALAAGNKLGGKNGQQNTDGKPAEV